MAFLSLLHKCPSFLEAPRLFIHLNADLLSESVPNEQKRNEAPASGESSLNPFRAITVTGLTVSNTILHYPVRLIAKNTRTVMKRSRIIFFFARSTKKTSDKERPKSRTDCDRCFTADFAAKVRVKNRDGYSSRNEVIRVICRSASTAPFSTINRVLGRVGDSPA